MTGDTSPDAASERAMFATTADAMPVRAKPAPVAPLRPPAEMPLKLPVRLPDPSKSLRILRERAALVSRRSLARAITTAVSTEIDRGTGFILIPVFLALGAIAYFSFAREPGFATLAAASLGLTTIVILARPLPVLHLAACAALLFLLGVVFAKLETHRAATKVVGSEISTLLTGMSLRSSIWPTAASG